MTQEEKLEEAKRLYETANTDQRYVLESLFPELKESEDEGICRKLIAFLRQCRAVYGDGFKQFGLDIDDALAWLEKQGRQKPAEFDDTNAKRMFIKALESVEEQNNKGYKLTDCDKNSWWEDFKAYTYCTIEQKSVIKMKTPEESLGIDSDTYNKIVDECVYGEQKPAWSEEDEKVIHCLEYTVKHFYEDEDTIKWCCDWLKSLRPQSLWKPSKKQIIAIRWVLHHIPYDSHKEEISGLLDQILKL